MVTMQRCMLIILFAFSLIFDTHRAFSYIPDMPKFDVLTKADNKWWIPAGQYKVADEKPTVRSTDRSAKERHVSPPRVNTRFEEICKGTSEFSSDLFEFAKSCIPEEVKGAGQFIFEYAKENSPQFVRQSFEFTAEKLAWAMSGLEEAVSDSEPSVRRYLRDDLGLPQWVSQDIGSIVGIGGKCVLAFMPGKVISESTKVIKLISVSFANGAGAGFKIALEQPLAKYKTVKFEKPKGAPSKGGTVLEKEPKEPKMKEVKAAKSERVILEYGKGKFWDGLINKKQDKSLESISRRTQSKIRKDSDGYFYKFDPAHKTAKVHLHKYKHNGGNKYELIAEVNPETGEIKPIVGKVETW